MANKEHLAILKQGVEVWNKWREEIYIKPDLSGADLSGAKLERSILVRSNLERTNLTGCHIYGISAWDLRLKEAVQSDLVITPCWGDTPRITVDDLEVSQFIYLLLNNRRLGKVIDTIGRKGVLILGRFSEERKPVLDGLRKHLRKQDYLPILFDFDPASSQTTMDTISTLAHLSRFVIADLTDAKSILAELERITTLLPSVLVQLIVHESGNMPPMSDSFLVRESVLPPYSYSSQAELLSSLKSEVILPAEEKSNAFQEKLAEIRGKHVPWQLPAGEEE